jgi:Protein of unknown function (DUF2586)
MALNDIVFVKGQGGLGRPLAGQDYVSGLLFYTDNGNLPSGFTTSARTKEIFSVADAEALGIVSDCSDATAATFEITITDMGNDGDTFNLSFNEIHDEVVNIGTYTKVSGDSTETLVATAITAMINAGTYSHGYSATSSGTTVLLICPKKLGAYPNSGTPVIITIVGAITNNAPSLDTNGYHSRLSLWHYHISEYFRLQPKGDLFVSFQAYPSTWDFAEITQIQNFANGRIRQIGVWVKWRAFSTADIQAISDQIKDNCDANHKPLSALYSGKVSSGTDLTTLTNLNTLDANKCSAVIGQDGAGKGDYLYQSTGATAISISNIGATLGAIAKAAVSDSIEWIGKFNVSNGTECDTPAFVNGQKISEVSQGTLVLLDNYRYVFLLKYVDLAGSYFNDSHTAVIETSDYAYIENNRTIDKAIRGIYSSVLPALGSPIVLNADGTLTDTSIAYFTSLAELNLTQMVRDTELSNFQVLINSTQDVLSTGKLVIAVELLPVGVARSIQVNIGFVTSLS